MPRHTSADILRCMVAIAAANAIAGSPKDAIALSCSVTIVRQSEIAENVAADYVKNIIANVGELLKQSDGPNDKPISINISNLLPLGSSGSFPAVIRTEAHWQQILNAPGTIKLVKLIRYCPGFGGGNKFGCSSIGAPGVMVALTDFDEGTKTVLWAHELTHTAGQLDQNTATFLMHKDIKAANRSITQDDNSAIAGGFPPSGTCLGASNLAGVLNAATNAISTTPSGTPANTDLPAVQEFVETVWPHGVPFEDATRYTPDAIPYLRSLLTDPSKQQFWNNAVLVLGAIASPDARDALLEFLFRDREGSLSIPAYNAKADTMIALGWLVRRSNDGSALQVLLQATDPQWWGDQSFTMTSDIFPDTAASNRNLALSAIEGLKRTDTAESRARLAALERAVQGLTLPSATPDTDRQLMIQRFGAALAARVLNTNDQTMIMLEESGGLDFLRQSTIP